MIKYFIYTLFITAVAFASCNDSNGSNSNLSDKQQQQIENDSANFTTIQWLDSMKNFGTAKYGDKVNVEYQFKNTGNKPLYLISVRPTCGCTIADYTKNAVMPNNTGFVKAVYDSKHGVPGAVGKTIIVTSNTKNDTRFVLAFKGNVEK